MSVLRNKIDFTAIISATQCNPNGDPLNGNRPRTTFAGYGEITDVCIKRKIRNRLQDMGENIFMQSEDRCEDGYDSTDARAKASIAKEATKEEFAAQACEKWIDVRSFGQVFAIKGKKQEKGEKQESGVSISVRGPVSIHNARSVDPVDISSFQITKSVNGQSGDKKGPDTMGMKHMVEFGLYIIKGSINVQLAEKTGFTEEDAEKIKESLRTLFVNDASAARPDGSMEVVKVVWWKHNNKLGQYSSAKVHRAVHVTAKEDVTTPKSVDDYHIEIKPLEGLETEIIEGI